MNSQATGPILKKLLDAPDFDAQIDTLLTERFDTGYIAAIEFVLKKLSINIYHTTVDQRGVYRNLYEFTKAKIKPFLVSMKKRDTCSLDDDMRDEIDQLRLLLPNNTDQNGDRPDTLTLYDIPTILYTILIYLLNPFLRIAMRPSLIQKAELGMLHVVNNDNMGHIISFFRCNGKEFVDFAQAQKTSKTQQTTIYPFNWSLFFNRLNWISLYEKFETLDINMLIITIPIHVRTIYGKEFTLPVYNLVYKNMKGNYLFLLNDTFEEIAIPPTNIEHEFFSKTLLYFINTNIGRRTFIPARWSGWIGGNRTKRNRKNRKNTRKLKRKQ